MTVYILYDEWPEMLVRQINSGFIQAVYATRELAESAVRQLKKKDAYSFQYVSIIPKKVIGVQSQLREAQKLFASRAGRATSRKKAKASRKNGKLGGRPRKR